MIGPILLAASWILLRFEGRALGALGVDAPLLRLRQFGAGYLVRAYPRATASSGDSLTT